MDGAIDQYITQIHAATTQTRGFIAQSLEDVARVVRQHDDNLDRVRNLTLEEMHRVTGTVRGEAERITDNLVEVIEEIRDRHANDVTQPRKGQNQPEPSRAQTALAYRT
eukprot:7350404-Karenia_brevis.AAC.1